MLVKVKPNGYAFPAPLQFRDNTLNVNELSGDKRVVSAGHSWGQSMKFEDAHNGPPDYYTVINTNSRAVQLKYTFLHNILLQPGHSGGPIMVQQPNNTYQLVGIQGSTEGLDTSNSLGEKGLRVDNAPNPQDSPLDWSRATINLILPARANEPERFCIANRTEFWEPLLRGNSLIRIYWKMRATPGTIDLYLRVRSTDGLSTYARLLRGGIAAAVGSYSGTANIAYDTLGFNVDTPPAFIVGITAVWTPAGANPAQVPPSAPYDEAQAAAARSAPAQHYALEALGLAVAKNGDDRVGSRTDLFYREFGAQEGSSSTPRSMITDFAWASKLPKANRDSLDLLLDSFKRS